MSIQHKGKELIQLLFSKTGAVLLTSLSLLAALAWNDYIKQKMKDDPKLKDFPKWGFALAITVAVVILPIIYLFIQNRWLGGKKVREMLKSQKLAL